jgi:hypothetical protein
VEEDGLGGGDVFFVAESELTGAVGAEGLEEEHGVFGDLFSESWRREL